jgi:hypothetical protein
VLCSGFLPWWHRSTAYAAIGLFLFSPAICSCTSVIAFLSDQTVVIAADSKETVFLTNGKKSYRKDCKIHTKGNFAWAVWGILGNTDGSSINKSIESVAITDHSIAEKIARSDELTIDFIHWAGRHFRVDNPQLFQKVITTQEFLSELFVGFDGNELSVSNRDYFIEIIKGKINVESKGARDCPKGCPNPALFVIGTQEAVQKYIASHPQVMKPPTLQIAIDTVVKLVQTEMDASPDSVGPPIETAIIDRQGVHWSPHNTQCPKTGESAKPTTPQKPRDK